MHHKQIYMIVNRKNILIELASRKELEKNKFCQILARYESLNIGKKENVLDLLAPYYNEIQTRKLNKIESNEPTEIDNWIGKDLRIKNIQLSSIRGLPKSEKPFTIDLQNDTSSGPASIIVLGKNGSCKSSIYNAIEYNYCKRIGEYELRTQDHLNDEAKEFKNYLRHFGNEFETSYCQIQTVDKVLSIHEAGIPNEVRSYINPNTHFISDFDIYQNGKLEFQTGEDNSFHNLIAESLGLKDLLGLETDIKRFINYRRTKESNAINKLEKRKKDELSQLEKIENQLKTDFINSNKLDSSNNQNRIILNKLLDVRLNQNQVKNLETINNELIERIIEFNNATAIKYEFDIMENRGDNNTFYSLGLKLISNSNDCPFCEDSNKSKAELKEFIENKISNYKRESEIIKRVQNSFNLLINTFHDFTSQLKTIKSNTLKDYEQIKDYYQENQLSRFYLDLTEAIQIIENSLVFNSVLRIANDNNKLDSIYRKLALDNLSFEENKNTIDRIKKLTNNIESSKNLSIERLKEISESPILITKSSLEKQKKLINNSIKSLNKELEPLIQRLELFNQMKQESKELMKHLHKEINDEVMKSFRPIQFIVEDVLRKYLAKEEREVDIKIKIDPNEIDEETGEVLSEIIVAEIFDIKDGSRISVKNYFNTFHYRLFNSMVGIAIAIASRIRTNINLPLVIDDIFYSSDFENKASIEIFLNQVFEIFEEYTPNLKLQFIMFTHDLLIFQSAMKCIERSSNSEMRFGKLFGPNDVINQPYGLQIVHELANYIPSNLVHAKMMTTS